MTIFGLYTCKQASDESTYRKAKHIANFSTRNKVMHSDCFFDTIKKICELASTKFMKAVVETGYIEELYNEFDYKNI